MTRTQIFRFLASIALAPIVLVNPAMAHTDSAEITLAAAESPTADSRTFLIDIVFPGDGHRAEDATVTVAGDLAGSDAVASVGPDEMRQVPGVPGRYAATVTFPKAGSWGMRFTSISPAGYLEVTETVGSIATSSIVPTSVLPTSIAATSLAPKSLASTSIAATSTVAPTPTTTPTTPSTEIVPVESAASNLEESESGESAGDGGGIPGWAIGVGLLLVTGVALGGMSARRRRR